MTMRRARHVLPWFLALGFLLLSAAFLFQPAFSQQNILASTGSLQGVVTAEFKTQEGTMTLIAPEGLWAGGTFAGSVQVEPAGKTQAEKRKNREKILGQLTFQVASQVISLRDEYYNVTLAGTLSTAEQSVVLRDKKGKPLATTPLPVQPQPPAALATATLQGQKIVQAGRPMVFQGQGLVTPNLKTTSASIGGQLAKPLAATANTLAVQCPSSVQGAVPWQVTNGGVTSAGQTHVANVSFSASKNVIQPGEQVIAHLTVMGVEDSDEEIPVTVDNATTGTIRLSGGNHQVLRIPRAVERIEKDFTKDFTVTGVHAGSFDLVASLQSPFLALHGFDDDVVRCAKSGDCALSEKNNGPFQNATMSCNVGTCPTGCTCVLFKAKTVQPGDKDVEKWQRVKGNTEEKQGGYDYHCWCLE